MYDSFRISFLFLSFFSRKHYSVKFPDDLPITLPNLLRFILQYTSSVQYEDKHLTASGHSDGPGAVFQAEFLALQHKIHVLRHACESLSQKLAQLWDDNRLITFHTHSLDAQNTELEQERQSLEEQHRKKSQQLGEAVRRLQALLDTSENLLNENTMLRTLKDGTEAKEQLEAEREEAEKRRNHMAS